MNPVQSIVAAMAATLTGCALTSNKPIVDNSPRLPATLRVEQVSYSGGRGYFAYAGEQISRTRPERRRVQQSVAFTESALGALGAGARRAYLYDLRDPRGPNLIQVDYDNRSAHRCDLAGCFEHDGNSETVPAQAPLLDAERCEVQVVDSRATLEPVDQDDGGQAGRLFDFEWRIVLRDGQQRAGESRLSGQLRLSSTPAPEALVKREQAFTRRYIAAIGARWPEFAAALPSVPLAVMQKDFFASLGVAGRQRAAAASLPENLAGRIRSGELAWFVGGPVCGLDAPEWRRREQRGGEPRQPSGQGNTQPGGDGIDSADDFFAAVVAELSGDKREANDPENNKKTAPESPAGRQIFRYQWRVTSLSAGEVSQARLQAPDSFTSGRRF